MAVLAAASLGWLPAACLTALLGQPWELLHAKEQMEA